MPYAISYMDKILDAFRDRLSELRTELYRNPAYKDMAPGSVVSQQAQDELWKNFLDSYYWRPGILEADRHHRPLSTRPIMLDNAISTTQLMELFVVGFPQYIDARESVLRKYFEERVAFGKKNELKGLSIDYRLNLSVQTLNNKIVKSLDFESKEIYKIIGSTRKITDDIYYITESETDKFLEVYKSEIIKQLYDIEPGAEGFVVLATQNVLYASAKKGLLGKPVGPPLYQYQTRVKRSMREGEKTIDFLTGVRSRKLPDPIASLETVRTEQIPRVVRYIQETSDPASYSFELKPSTKQVAELIKAKPYLDHEKIWEYVGQFKFMDEHILKKSVAEIEQEYARINAAARNAARKLRRKEYSCSEEEEVLKIFALPGIWIDTSPKNARGINLEIILLNPEQSHIYKVEMPHDTGYVHFRATKRKESHVHNYSEHLEHRLHEWFSDLFPTTYGQKIINL